MIAGFFHRLEGPTTFKNNRANRAAGIFNVVELTTFSDFEEDYGREYRPAELTFPTDTVFRDNDANVSPERCVRASHACLLFY